MSDFEKKEILYKSLCKLCEKAQSTRIPDIVKGVGLKYASKIGLDSVKAASLIYEMNCNEKRVGSTVIPIDGHLYHVFFPCHNKPIKNDTNVLSFEPERKPAVVYSCPFECGRYLKVRSEL
jgi:hypothetical protein